MKTHGPLHVAGFVEPMFQQNAYLLWPDGQSAAWIIDPGFDPHAELLAAEITKQQLSPTAILITHAHVDHIAGVAALRALYPAALLHAPRDEQHMLVEPHANLSAHMGLSVTAPAADRAVTPGERLTLGGLEFVALDVAGHSPGGLAYYCRAAGVVFTGDALFAGSIGRTDFPGSSMRRLCGNIRDQLLTLPDETVVYSGHGPPTTIGEERDTNPFLGSGGNDE